MAASDGSVRSTAVSKWLRGALVGLLLAAVFGFNVFSNPFAMAVESPDSIDGSIFIALIASLFAQPVMVAMWMAFGTGTLAVRFSLGLLFTMLMCVTVAAGVYMVEWEFNEQVAAFPMTLALVAGVLLLPLIAFRWLTRWRIGVLGDSTPASAAGQFGIRSVMVWTLQIAMLAGMFKFLYGQVPSGDAQGLASTGGIFMVVYVAVAAIPLIAAAWFFLGIGRKMLMGAMVTLVALTMIGGGAIGLMVAGGSTVDQELPQVITMLAGLMSGSAFVYLILRGLGYRMVRSPKLLRADSSASLPSVIQPSEIQPSATITGTRFYGLRWQFAAAMFMALAACGSIGWRASQIVSVQWQAAEDERLRKLGIEVLREDLQIPVCCFSLRHDKTVDDALIRELDSLPGVLNLVLIGHPEPTQSLALLCGLKNARCLILENSAADDTDMEFVGQMTGLQYFDVTGTKITDAGLAKIKRLDNLRRFRASNTSITDAGLVNLYGLKLLSQIELKSTKVTEEGVQKLREALPSVNAQWQ